MNEEFLRHIEDETQNILRDAALPPTLGTFALDETYVAADNAVEIFNYNSRERHCTIRAYFDGATSEYKIRVRLGLNDWCLTRFFAANFDRFVRSLRAELDNLIKTFDVSGFKKNFFIEELKLIDWEYGKNLPPSIEGFNLFIAPSGPIEVTNGSFIVINYVDFDRARDLVVYYNIFSDEFSAEARDGAHTHVLYDLDAKNLSELESKLKRKLVDCIKVLDKQIFLV